jgi:hypothetical protein
MDRGMMTVMLVVMAAGAVNAAESTAPIYRFFGYQVELGEDPGSGTVVVGKGPMRVHVRDGRHTISPDDWRVYLDFIDEFLQPVNQPRALMGGGGRRSNRWESRYPRGAGLSAFMDVMEDLPCSNR